MNFKRYCEDDFVNLYEYLSDPEVVKYEYYRPMSIDEAKKKMIQNVYLGNRDFESIEIGYVFNHNYWGQGYAKESCKAMIDYCLQNT